LRIHVADRFSEIESSYFRIGRRFESFRFCQGNAGVAVYATPDSYSHWYETITTRLLDKREVVPFQTQIIFGVFESDSFGQKTYSTHVGETGISNEINGESYGHYFHDTQTSQGDRKHDSANEIGQAKDFLGLYLKKQQEGPFIFGAAFSGNLPAYLYEFLTRPNFIQFIGEQEWLKLLSEAKELVVPTEAAITESANCIYNKGRESGHGSPDW
jgi:hypothetical protein